MRICCQMLSDAGVTRWKTIIERISRLGINFYHIPLLWTHTPPEVSNETEKNVFYYQQEKNLDTIPAYPYKPNQFFPISL